jgi:hypothetical protein
MHRESDSATARDNCRFEDAFPKVAVAVLLASLWTPISQCNTHREKRKQEIDDDGFHFPRTVLLSLSLALSACVK